MIHTAAAIFKKILEDCCRKRMVFKFFHGLRALLRNMFRRVLQSMNERVSGDPKQKLALAPANTQHDIDKANKRDLNAD